MDRVLLVLGLLVDARVCISATVEVRRWASVSPLPVPLGLYPGAESLGHLETLHGA